jgi:uncharacterized membrane protein
MIGIIWSFITTRIPLKAWLYIFAVLAIAGGVFWFKHNIIASEKFKCVSGQLAQDNEALKKQLEESKQYAAFLLNAQKKNDNFIKKQKKDFYDAKDKDGAVADNLRNTLKRLSDSRAILDE